MIQGHHVYKDIIMPTIGKILQSGREPDNSYGSFVVAIIENGWTCASEYFSFEVLP